MKEQTNDGGLARKIQEILSIFGKRSHEHGSGESIRVHTIFLPHDSNGGMGDGIQLRSVYDRFPYTSFLEVVLNYRLVYSLRTEFYCEPTRDVVDHYIPGRWEKAVEEEYKRATEAKPNIVSQRERKREFHESPSYDTIIYINDD